MKPQQLLPLLFCFLAITSAFSQTPPADPPNPTASGNACGDKTLTRSGSPSGGVIWYWQLSAGGTDTSYGGSTHNVSSSGTYYIRAYKTSIDTWSDGAGYVDVTVTQNPSAPATPTFQDHCSTSTLTMNGSPPGGVSWYWQGTTSSGTSTADNTSTYHISGSGTYYIRALKAGTSCWSTSTSVTVTTTAAPSNPTPTSGYRCGPGVVSLSATAGSGGSTVKWYAASSGGSALTMDLTYEPSVSSTTTYYIATYNSTLGCESSRVSITATVYPKPVISATASTFNLGNTITLSTSTDTYTTYSWTLNGVQIATTSTLPITKPGIYVLSATKTGFLMSVTSDGKVMQTDIDAQSPLKNYVAVNDILKQNITDESDIETLAIGDRQRSVTYFGGLGNTIQTIVSQGSPAKYDIIQPVEYDVHGRTLKQYLPYIKSTVNDSKFRSAALTSGGYSGSEQYTFYQGSSDQVINDTKPYTLAEIEPSPLARMKAGTGVGNDWHTNSKKVRKSYLLNRSADNVRLWTISSGLPVSSGAYADYQLFLDVTADEDSNFVKVYSDRQGRSILKSVQSGASEWLKTYNIYNDLGQLVFVISPQGVSNLSGYSPTQAFLDQWAFQYKYDALGRMIESKAPGAGWMFTVYDPLDRPLLTQNADQRSRDEWSFVKYDVYGRAVLTGFKVITSSTRSSVQSSVDSQTYNYENIASNSVGYSLDRTYPSASSGDLLSIGYFDNYDFVGYSGWDAESNTYTFVSEQGSSSYSTAIEGLPTGGKTRVIANVPTSLWLNSVVYYDVRYRPIQTISENHLGGVDRTTNQYAFSGRLLYSKNTHNDGEITVLKKFQYDHAGRLTKVRQKNNSDTEVVVAAYTYNELGQLVDKKLHSTDSTNYLQSVDYRYTIRGWLQSINNAQLADDSGATNDEATDYFGMELIYNASDAGLSNTQYYNGNIGAMKWKTTGEASGTAGQRSYKYTYDKSDRLTQATFQAYGTSSWNKESNTLNEGMTYDYNGNILKLYRKQNTRGLSGTTVTSSALTIDTLTYTYAPGKSNRLTNVEDNGGTTAGFNNGVTQTTEYTYDTLGNLTADKNKGIDSIKYNQLNKVKRIKFSDGSAIAYTYDAAGNKLIVKNYNTGGTLVKTTDYIEGFVYTNTTLSFFGSPAGRVVNNSGTLEYQYSLTDHQGNTRAVFSSVTPAALDITATFEGDGGDYSGSFTNVSGVVSFSSANHTASGIKVVRMNQSNPVGPSKSLKVYPGDEIDLEVYSYFESGSGYGTSNNSGAAMITAIAAAFGGVSGAGGESGSIYSAVNTALGGFGLGTNPGDTRPSAFLNYILFDLNYKVVTMGYIVVPASAWFSKEKISISDILIKEAGYLFAYLSYEDQSNNYVYFDDFKVTHTKSKLIQASEYYPFGMQTARSWTRESVMENNFLGNGGTELNTLSNLYDLQFRNYDPVLCRMGQMDPMVHSLSSFSPYNYSFNNPVSLNDPLGDYPVPVPEENSVALYYSSGYARSGGGGGGTGQMYIDAHNVNAGIMSSDEYARKWGKDITASWNSISDNLKNGYTLSVKDDGTVAFDFSGSPNKLCGYYEFKQVAGSWTAEITRLSIMAMHKPSGKIVETSWGAWCVNLNVKDLNAERASALFKESWNYMTDELQGWLNEQGENAPSGRELAAKAIELFQANVREFSVGWGQVSTGPCLGYIPSSPARYECLFDF